MVISLQHRTVLEHQLESDFSKDFDRRFLMQKSNPFGTQVSWGMMIGSPHTQPARSSMTMVSSSILLR